MAERSYLTLESEVPLTYCLVLTSVLTVDMWSAPAPPQGWKCLEVLPWTLSHAQCEHSAFSRLSIFTEESVKWGEDREVTQRFRELFTLAEDSGLIPSTHVNGARTSVVSILGD